MEGDAGTDGAEADGSDIGPVLRYSLGFFYPINETPIYDVKYGYLE